MTAPIELEWDPDEISQIIHQEEELDNPLATIASGLNNLGRRVSEMDRAAQRWADAMEQLVSTISTMYHEEAK